MKTNITFTMIKPNAVKRNVAGKITDMISEAGFKIKALKITQLTKDEAEEFYAVHKGKSFYDKLIDFMSSGPIYAAVLEKENAVEAYRNFIGNTNPEEAAEGTIRRMFGESIQKNAVHGSDSNINAQIESNFFFARREWL